MTKDTIEGKTKVLEPLPDGLVRVRSKDDITAGDGAKRDLLHRKGVLANAITCDVFEMLQHHEVPLAFIERDGDEFITKLATMVPIEVVVRNRATGSALKRNPKLRDGQLYLVPEVEFFYKTTGKKLGEVNLPCDDPLALPQPDGSIELYHPGKPPVGEPIHVVTPCANAANLHQELFHRLKNLALRVNKHLKWAWEQQGGELWDFKIECGWVAGELVVADVIDFDSWRVFVNGKPVSKQLYRDDAPLDAVMKAMHLTAKMTRGFVY